MSDQGDVLHEDQNDQQEEQPEQNEDQEQQEPQTQGGEEEEEEPVPKKKPKIRPLPPRGEVPKDKDQLIKYLTDRLAHAENSINDSHQYLGKQKQKRKDLQAKLNDKTKQLDEIRQQENQTLQEKIDHRLQLTLEKAAQHKIAAEDALKEVQMIIFEKERMIEELDHTVINQHIDITQKDEKIIELNQIIDEQNDKIQELLDIQKHLEDSNAAKDQQIHDLTYDVAEMRGVMLKLSDVRNVLNRVFENPDNYSKRAHEIIDNPGIFITVKRDERHEKTLPHPSDLQAKPNTTLKPTYLTNEDDFWYSTVIAGQGSQNQNTYAQDYGGKNKNYNENYLYGSAKANTSGQSNQGSPGNSQVIANAEKKRRPTPGDKLPKIQRGQKGEILYRADEYIDEFNKQQAKQQQPKKNYQSAAALKRTNL